MKISMFQLKRSEQTDQENRRSCCWLVNLEEAEIIVAGGRGVGPEEGFGVIRRVSRCIWGNRRRIRVQLLMKDDRTCTSGRPDR